MLESANIQDIIAIAGFHNPAKKIIRQRKDLPQGRKKAGRTGRKGGVLMALRVFLSTLAVLPLLAGGYGQNISDFVPAGDEEVAAPESATPSPVERVDSPPPVESPTRVTTRVRVAASQSADTPYWQTREGHDEAARRVLSSSGTTKVSPSGTVRYPNDYARASQVNYLAAEVKRLEALLTERPTDKVVWEMLNQQKKALVDALRDEEKLQKNLSAVSDYALEVVVVTLTILIAAVAAAIGYALRQSH